MTTDEKLQHFYDVSVEAARADARKMIEEHRAALENLFAEHQDSKRRQAEAELKTESDRLKREHNKEIALRQTEIRRRRAATANDIRDRLFFEVEEKLTAFKKTPDYKAMLCRQIREAFAFADGDEMIIYIDPSDAGLADEITKELQIDGFAPTISRDSFFGGMRAVIRSKNILIDNSFLTLTNDAKEKFNLEVS